MAECDSPSGFHASTPGWHHEAAPRSGTEMANCVRTSGSLILMQSCLHTWPLSPAHLLGDWKTHMSSTARQSSRFKVGDWVSFLYGPQKVKARVIEDRGLLGSRGRRLYRVGFNAGQEETTSLEIPEEDLKLVEQPDSSSRQSFRVRYVRQTGSNNWVANTKWEGLYKGMNAKGAVAYSTARWEGEPQQEERYATVAVFVESHPRLDEEDLHDHPSVLRKMIEETRELADAMFKARHPDARIEHRD